MGLGESDFANRVASARALAIKIAMKTSKNRKSCSWHLIEQISVNAAWPPSLPQDGPSHPTTGLSHTSGGSRGNESVASPENRRIRHGFRMKRADSPRRQPELPRFCAACTPPSASSSAKGVPVARVGTRRHLTIGSAALAKRQTLDEKVAPGRVAHVIRGAALAKIKVPGRLSSWKPSASGMRSASGH